MGCGFGMAGGSLGNVDAVGIGTLSSRSCVLIYLSGQDTEGVAGAVLHWAEDPSSGCCPGGTIAFPGVSRTLDIV